jgi:hypothetical protein
MSIGNVGKVEHVAPFVVALYVGDGALRIAQGIR